MYSIGKKYQNYCDFSFIYDRENLLEMKDSPTDKGADIFWKLYNRRVRIITEEISSERAVKAMGQVLKDLSILNGEISRSTIEEIKEVTF